jgi:hypothetical protein
MSREGLMKTSIDSPDRAKLERDLI